MSESDVQLVISLKKGMSSTKGMLKCYGLEEEAFKLKETRRQERVKTPGKSTTPVLIE
jgi:hypothetical protein